MHHILQYTTISIELFSCNSKHLHVDSTLLFVVANIRMLS